MTTLDIAHKTLEHYLKYCFKKALVEQVNRPKYHRNNALRISFGCQLDHMDYCLHLVLSTPYWGALVKDIHELRRIKASKRRQAFKHTRVPRQVQYSLKRLDPLTQVLIIYKEYEFSKKKIDGILREWPATKPLIFLG